MFMLNGLLLALTSLLLSAAGLWLNVFLTARLSTAGMGLYQLILSVYTFGATLSCAGIQLAATRITAEELAKGGESRLRKAMGSCIRFSLVFGCLAGCLLMVLSPWLGDRVIGDAASVLPLRLMAMTLPVLSVCATVCGYFTAVRRVYKTALCNVTEQGLRIMLTVTGVTLLVEPQDVASGVVVLAGSGLLAEVLSFCLEYILYRLDVGRYPKGDGPPDVWQRLRGICLPVAFSSYLRSGLTTTKNLLAPGRLMASGLTETAALSMFGAVHGVALPVILFPASILGAFSGLIVPEVAESHVQGKSTLGHIHRLLVLNLTASICIGTGLFVFAGELGQAMSLDPDIGVYIRLLAPVAPVMYMDTAVDCLLKGIDEQMAVMRYNIYDAAISLLMVWVFLPAMGVKGYILMVLLSEVMNLAMSFHYLAQKTGYGLDVIELLAKPLLCAVTAALGVRALLLWAKIPGGAVVTAALALSLTGVLYTVFLWILRKGILNVPLPEEQDSRKKMNAAFSPEARVSFQGIGKS